MTGPWGARRDPTAQRPAISPGYCLGPQPKTWSCSLRSAPRAWDGIVGTAGLSARKLPGELRAAGRGSGKLATRQRDEGEDGEGEARPPASRSRLREPELEEEEPELERGRRGERYGAAPLLWKRSSRRRGGVPHGSGSWGPAGSALSLSLSSPIGMLRFGTAGPARSRPHHPKRRAAN